MTWKWNAVWMKQTREREEKKMINCFSFIWRLHHTHHLFTVSVCVYVDYQRANNRIHSLHFVAVHTFVDLCFSYARRFFCCCFVFLFAAFGAFVIFRLIGWSREITLTNCLFCLNRVFFFSRWKDSQHSPEKINCLFFHWKKINKVFEWREKIPEKKSK